MRLKDTFKDFVEKEWHNAPEKLLIMRYVKELKERK